MADALPTLYLLDASIGRTGALVAATHIAQSLAGRARVVLVLPQGARIAPEWVRDFSWVEFIPLTRLSKRWRDLVCYLPALVAGAWKLRAWMKRDGAHCLLVNDFYLMQGVLLRALGYRGRLLQWVRCEPRRFAGPLAPLMLRLVSCAADRVVAVSAFVRSLLPSSMTSELLYDYCALEPRAPIRWQAEDVKSLVYIAHYIPGKGQDMALEAFAQAAARDTTLRLEFYGGDMGMVKNRAYRAALEARAQSLGLAARVSFHDALEECAPVLARAYAALNFSQSESFSMTVLEASSSGVPVIATSSGGPQEIIVEGITGYLVPVGDVAAAAARIISLAQDVSLANAMGSAAAKHAHEKFSREVFAQSLVALGTV